MNPEEPATLIPPPGNTPLFTPEPPPPSALRYLFLGPNGLRPGWGLLLFVLLFTVLRFTLGTLASTLHPSAATHTAAQIETSGKMLTGEGIAVLAAALATWIMGRVERRSAADYGFAKTRRLSLFLTGFAWGLTFLSLLVAALWKLHLLIFDGLLLTRSEIPQQALIWLLGFLLVALLEESLLRSYVQSTLARGIASLSNELFALPHAKTLGFWTSAAILSFLFGLGHASNPGESPVGLVSAGLIGLIFCLSLWRTGSLWWAIGFHTAWDWAQSFLFGVADSGFLIQGRLLASHPTGNILLSGGTTGPEGSALILPILVLLTAVIFFLPKSQEPKATRL